MEKNIMIFKSIISAKTYISKELPPGSYRISPIGTDKYTIEDKIEQERRLKEMFSTNGHSCKVPYLLKDKTWLANITT